MIKKQNQNILAAKQDYKHWSKYFNLKYWTLVTIDKASSKHSLWILAIFCFLEAIIVPIPPELIVAPIILADRKKVFKVFFITTIFTVIGGFVAWCLGYFLFDTIGKSIIEYYNLTQNVNYFFTLYNKYDSEIILLGAVTPLPYKIIAISSGLAGIKVLTFIVYSLIGRSIRFAILCLVLYFFAKKINQAILNHFGLISFVVFIILILILFLI